MDPAAAAAAGAGRITDRSDLDQGLRRLVAADPRLVAVAAVALASGPLPLRLQPAGFAGLAFLVVSQMVSRASADAIWARLSSAMPALTPAAYLALGDQGLRLGLSRAKHLCLTDVARESVEGRLDLVALAEAPADEALAALTGLRGIGLWTAEVYLLQCGGHADLFPAGDVALRSAVQSGLHLERRPGVEETRAIARVWSPLRSVAARLFWAYYGQPGGGVTARAVGT